ncbi:hypothetical protein HYW44_04920 [Candidatus Daviesbacteria bacterium]|nr:hypothetical protein [Candidatus Daviesbacteria bacterium]
MEAGEEVGKGIKPLTGISCGVRLVIMPASKIDSKGFAHILFILAGLILFGFASTSVIKTTREFPQFNSSSVLGEDEEVKEEEKKAKEEIKKEEKRLNEDEKKVEEVKKEEEKKTGGEKKNQERVIKIQKKQESEFKLKQDREFKVKTSSESGKSETEIESEEGKFKSKIEDDGRIKVEIERGKFKVKFENGTLKIEREREGTGEAEFERDELHEEEIEDIEDEIEDKLLEEGIEIATSSGGVVIKKNNKKARTQFPLSINPETNELVVTTPSGQKTVAVLPDQAIENMLSNSVLSDIGQEDGEDSVEIETRNDELVYKIKGEKSHKFLGFIPLKTAITAFVSAQTGQLTAEEQSLFSRFIDQISF